MVSRVLAMCCYCVAGKEQTQQTSHTRQGSVIVATESEALEELGILLTI